MLFSAWPDGRSSLGNERSKVAGSQFSYRIFNCIHDGLRRFSVGVSGRGKSVPF